MQLINPPKIGNLGAFFSSKDVHQSKQYRPHDQNNIFISTEDLMLSNYGAGEDSCKSLGKQGDRPVNPKGNQP